ncbi:hypothetical protein AQUCO_04200143v1 [Aquilegia coerulea]|uniref:LOB domain-containing protein n=1 Tax=Aquilegia coerulea TaxID=218851 RepID=A0A2G5CPG4_AQUCA|nr:hypothetical protein AQUCO_04200143v1 [Aquilegia coerulea]
MSCNGCRVLRKGCSESCILRPCLQWIESPEAQGHATVFIAKFFGRAGLMSFISSVPESQRPALFQSLLFEACGRTVNPVNGAVGLLWTGNWHICQAAVETVLRGGTLRPINEVLGASLMMMPESADEMSEVITTTQDPTYSRPKVMHIKKKEIIHENVNKIMIHDLDLSLTSGSSSPRKTTKRSTTPSTEESVTTSLDSGAGVWRDDHYLRRGSGEDNNNNGDQKLLNLFV